MFRYVIVDCQVVWNVHPALQEQQESVHGIFCHLEQVFAIGAQKLPNLAPESCGA